MTAFYGTHRETPPVVHKLMEIQLSSLLWDTTMMTIPDKLLAVHI